jgi:hypothetical protein
VMYMNVEPDIDKWFEFVDLVRNHVFGADQVTVFYDELATDLPIEVMFVGANGTSMSVYVDEGVAQDYRMDLFSRADANRVADAYWKD